MDDWKKYWNNKRKSSKSRKIPYTLNPLQEEMLKERAQKNGYTIGRHKGMYHLGRIDHDRGYSYDNVEWQSVEDNSREVHDRYPKGYFSNGWTQEHRHKIIEIQKKNDHFNKMKVIKWIRDGGIPCQPCRDTRFRKGKCTHRSPVPEELMEKYGLHSST